jgi:hypothetical protein
VDVGISTEQVNQPKIMIELDDSSNSSGDSSFTLDSEDSAYDATVVKIKLNAKKRDPNTPKHDYGSNMSNSPSHYTIENRVNLLDDMEGFKG